MAFSVRKGADVFPLLMVAIAFAVGVLGGLGIIALAWQATR